MRMQSFHLSTQGASHIKKNKECQDASESYYDERCAIAIVCDGHGGDDYVRSASGSAFACAAAKTSILNFIENVNRDELTRHHNQLIHNLKASIISAWNEAVYEHYEANPFTEAEIAVLSDRAKRKYLQEKRIESAYGTTLIAVACTKDYWFGIHIGDGKCVAINPEGKFVQPIPWDEKCFLNATTSICDTDALNRFRSFCYIEINRYNLDGTQIMEPAGYMKMAGGKIGAHQISGMVDPDLGMARLNGTLSGDPIDANAIEGFLCQSCLDEFDSHYFEHDNVYSLAVFNFSAKTLRPLVESSPWYAADHYSVDCHYEDDGKIDLTIYYCPPRFEE